MPKRIPILIIEDDLDFLELMDGALHLGGFKVYKAENGRKGLKIARRKKISVILLDTSMPEMDGLEVLSELKYNEKTENIPVIMLTGKSMMGDIEKAFKLGADDYITKPVAISDIADKIKAKLRKLRKLPLNI
jgi:DNA-binding response OmpR family regulator